MVICCASQKGGVGKTTTAVNLAICLARRGRPVLAVDCDPQATMTRQLGIAAPAVELTLIDVLARRAHAGDALLIEAAPGVDLIAVARELSGVEMALVGELDRERFLADALEPITARYPTIVLDTPPNLGLLTVNALVSADIVLAPVSCEDEASVQGLVELRGTLLKLGRLRDSNPELLTLLTRWAPVRAMSQVIEMALVELGRLSPRCRRARRSARLAASTCHWRSRRQTDARRSPTSASRTGLPKPNGSSRR